MASGSKGFTLPTLRERDLPLSERALRAAVTPEMVLQVLRHFGWRRFPDRERHAVGVRGREHVWVCRREGEREDSFAYCALDVVLRDYFTTKHSGEKSWYPPVLVNIYDHEEGKGWESLGAGESDVCYTINLYHFNNDTDEFTKDPSFPTNPRAFAIAMAHVINDFADEIVDSLSG